MRSILTFLLAALIMPSLAQDSTSVKKFYVELGGGYCFPHVNDELQSPRAEVGTLDVLMRPDSTYSVRPVQGTLGQGWRGSLNVGYMFHKNIGVEFQFNYVRGDNILMSRIETPTYSASHHLMSQRVEVIPQLVLNHQMGKWGIYSKTGVILPIWGYVESAIEVDDKEGRVMELLVGGVLPWVESEVSATARTNPKFSYGFQTRLGVSFDVADWLSVFTEASYGALSVRAKETITENFEANIYNTISESSQTMTADDLSIYNLNSNYVDELTEQSNNFDYNSNADPNKAIDEPAFKDNFNHVGVNVGLRFKLF